MRRTVSLHLLLAATTIALASASAFAATAELPTRTVMTEADCRDVTERRELRGRPIGKRVATIWEARRSVWDGLPVFSGVKERVIEWFDDGQPGLEAEGLGGFQNVVRMRTLQYDLLCAQLLKCGDLDVARAVVRGASPTGLYCRPEWEALASDNRLTVAERIACWRRAHYPRGVVKLDDAAVAAFWDGIGAQMDSDDIVASMEGFGAFPWDVFARAASSKAVVSEAHLDGLLRPLVVPERIGVRGGRLVSRAIGSWFAVRGADDERVVRHVFSMLETLDRAGESLSEVLWRGIRGVDAFGDAQAERLLAMAQTARLPANAARAFYVYLRTPAGRRAIAAGGAMQDVVARYMASALAKDDRETAIAFLHALTGRRRADGRRFTHYPLGQYLAQCRVTVVVATEDELGIVREAWAGVPDALSRVGLPGTDDADVVPAEVF